MSYAALGQHFAPPARQARIDLGPEIPGVTPPERYESRQMFEKGLNAMLALSRRPRELQDPVSPTSSPALREYQEASQWLQLRDPALAAELAHTTGQMGVMAQRRQASTVLFKRPPGPIPGLGPVGDVPWALAFVDARDLGWAVAIAAGVMVGVATVGRYGLRLSRGDSEKAMWGAGIVSVPLVLGTLAWSRRRLAKASEQSAP